ncbi:MAG TPA: chemotaxis protein CheX [Bacilli bacterium]
MKSEYINPFLESARVVIEQVINVRPVTGELGVKKLKYLEDYLWIEIGMSGQMTGDIVFGLRKECALKIISAMMGGYAITEIDELGKSAISELGNMISGNASTLLYGQGIKVDITPPRVIHTEGNHDFIDKKALTIPLKMENIGELDIQVIIA